MRTLWTAVCSLALVAASLAAAPTLDLSTAQVEMSFTAGPNQSAAPVELRLDLAPGTTWTDTTRMVMNQSMAMPALPNMPPVAPQQTQMDVRMVMRNTALPGSVEGQHRIETVIADGAVSMTVNGQPMNMAQMGVDPMAQVRGQRFVTVVDSRGMPADLAGSLGAIFGGVGGGPMGGGEQGPSPAMQGCVLPDRPVRPGDSWTMTVRFPGHDQVRMVATNTLDRVEEAGGQRVAVISNSTSMSVPSPVLMANPQMPGLSMPINRMAMTAESVTRHFVESGHRGPTTGSLNLTMSMGMPTIPGAPAPEGMAESQMEMTMNGTFESDVTYGP